jgi:hypothetical protein
METAKPSNSITLKQVWTYTYRTLPTRFKNFKRDILPSRIRVLNRKVYKKDRIDQFDEFLEIQSYSAPQYSPYTRIKDKRSSKQMKIKHHYDIAIQFQKDKKGIYSFDSKIRWRIGSYKKWEEPSQNKISSIYKRTKDKLKTRLKRKYDEDEDRVAMKDDYDEVLYKIKMNADYLDTGDYNSRKLGINGDFYFRDQPLMYRYGCLYGFPSNTELSANKKDKKIKFPFVDKHLIGIIFFLYKKHYIKGLIP